MNLNRYDGTMSRRGVAESLINDDADLCDEALDRPTGKADAFCGTSPNCGCWRLGE